MINFATRRRIDYGAGKREAMARAKHRAKRPLALLRSQFSGRERADPPPPGKTQRGLDCFRFRKVARSFRILFRNPCTLKCLADAPASISARGKRPRLRKREGLVVDVAEPGEPIDQRRNVGGLPICPPMLAQLSIKVGGKLGAARRKAPHIENRQLVQLRGVERRSGLARLSGIHGHVCAT